MICTISSVALGLENAKGHIDVEGHTKATRWRACASCVSFSVVHFPACIFMRTFCFRLLLREASYQDPSVQGGSARVK